MPTIKAVYIGCKATEEFISDIKKAHKGIPLFRMIRKNGEYELTYEKIEDQD